MICFGLVRMIMTIPIGVLSKPHHTTCAAPSFLGMTSGQSLEKTQRSFVIPLLVEARCDTDYVQNGRVNGERRG